MFNYREQEVDHALSNRVIQRTIYEVRIYVALITLQKNSSKCEFVVFVNKIQFQSNKVCYKVSLCENVVVEPFPYVTMYRCWRSKRNPST